MSTMQLPAKARKRAERAGEALQSFSQLGAKVLGPRAEQEAVPPTQQPAEPVSSKEPTSLNTPVAPQMPEPPAEPELAVTLTATASFLGKHLVLQPGQVASVWDLRAWSPIARLEIEAVIAVWLGKQLVGSTTQTSFSEDELDLMVTAEVKGTESPVLAKQLAAIREAELGNIGGVYRYVLPELPLGMLCSAGQSGGWEGNGVWRFKPLSPVHAYRRWTQTTQTGEMADIRPSFFIEDADGVEQFDVVSGGMVRLTPFPLPVSFEPAELVAQQACGGHPDIDHWMRSIVAGFNRWRSEKSFAGRIWFGLGLSEPVTQIVTTHQFWNEGRGAWPLGVKIPLTDHKHGLRLLAPHAVQMTRDWQEACRPAPAPIKFRGGLQHPPAESFAS